MGHVGVDAGLDHAAGTGVGMGAGRRGDMRCTLERSCRSAGTACAEAALPPAVPTGPDRRRGGGARSCPLLVPDALELAAGACANRELAVRLAEAGVAVRSGRLPDLVAALSACGMSGDELELIRTGERSGKLEEGLAQARVLAAERFAIRLQWTARAVTGAVYGLAMLIAAATIFTMFAKTYAPLMRELEAE